MEKKCLVKRYKGKGLKNSSTQIGYRKKEWPKRFQLNMLPSGRLCVIVKVMVILRALLRVFDANRKDD
jgi:hypothetical protein